MTDSDAGGGTRAPGRAPKNILIFSDGTGQSGGLTPDQRLSNVYKLYRASRVGPDNDIDPRDQIAFYDPGLGSEGETSRVKGRWVRAFRKFASSATGAGIGRNITDCYEAILKHYEAGDRVYIMGFSRGAYTARCVAGVLRYCGVPSRCPDGSPIPRWGSGLRAIASEAVHKVYEHGSGRKRSKYQPQREELARRFRRKYGCGGDQRANVAPYFIGVFDTVAALGVSGVKRWIMLSVLALCLLGAVTGVAVILSLFGAPFRAAFIYAAASAAALGLIGFTKARLKVIWNYPAKGRFSWHWTGWRFSNYDTNLDSQVPYARHALAIDETRADFQRVGWGQPSEGDRGKIEGVESFVQLWFAGNHSDIGGSYLEDESRLSDISLGWMVAEIDSLPEPIKLDRAKLRLWPAADGQQHCEVEGLRDLYPRWVPRFLRFTWSEKLRLAAAGAPHHPTVLERFGLAQVVQCRGVAPYRPKALRNDPRYASFY